MLVKQKIVVSEKIGNGWSTGTYPNLPQAIFRLKPEKIPWEFVCNMRRTHGGQILTPNLLMKNFYITLQVSRLEFLLKRHLGLLKTLIPNITEPSLPRLHGLP